MYYDIFAVNYTSYCTGLSNKVTTEFKMMWWRRRWPRYIDYHSLIKETIKCPDKCPQRERVCCQVFFFQSRHRLIHITSAALPHLQSVAMEDKAPCLVSKLLTFQSSQSRKWDTWHHVLKSKISTLNTLGTVGKYPLCLTIHLNPDRNIILSTHKWFIGRLLTNSTMKTKQRQNHRHNLSY